MGFRGQPVELALEKEEETEARVNEDTGVVWPGRIKAGFPEQEVEADRSSYEDNGCVGVCGRETQIHCLQALQPGEKAGLPGCVDDQCRCLPRVFSPTILTWDFP